ncbi:molybdopterin-dependent oxidoreductase [Congregibacter brevis]|uniref:Molybdopterin-dependent oxidoreductase n=1 Tax=Congregibacter brevis TaxID=3081201 RepID=A0ABZ0ICD3_9GAMM|nr:molybdopterin-dependent oxidoreductase [Congregibacter sp. IMCC45268]
MSDDGKTTGKYIAPLNRRRFLGGVSAAVLSASTLRSFASTPNTSEGVSLSAGPRPLVRYPEKRELIRVHTRPPHLETPFEVFNESVITPNDAFFVRYHLANFPTNIDPETFRLKVGGHVDKPLSLSLTDLKTMTDAQEVVAVNQCSGNSRGYFEPRVFGAQLGNGAMGNARWTGAPLRAVLNSAGVRKGAQHVVFNGLDKPVLNTTPDFQKSLEIDHALSAEPLLAWSMNGVDIPFLNGYPLKLIVPGYFGTYWVKHLSEITVLDGMFTGQDAYFMTKGYRLPDNDCHCVEPGDAPSDTRPISRIPVRSFVTSISTGDLMPVKRDIELRGIAFDGGSGINRVEVSIDNGQLWQQAKLGNDLGPYSFREWRLRTQFPVKGATTVRVRANSKRGETQPERATWNPGGYHRNVVETVEVMVS